MEKRPLIENVSGEICVTIFMNNETQADIELVKTQKIRGVDFSPDNMFKKTKTKETYK
jgi:hypothetical protein